MTEHVFFNRRDWGHDYTVHRVWHGGREIDVSGWCRGIQEGDTLVLESNGRPSTYRVASIRYARDPRDMFHATLTYVGSSESQGDT